MSGNRPWTVDDLEILRLMRGYGLPFSLIAKTLQRTEQAIIVKASKHCISAPRKNTIEDDELVSNQRTFLTLDSKIIGSITEDQVKIKLSIAGFDVFSPYMNNHKTDLVIANGSIICKIQIKSAVYDQENKRFRSQLRTKNRKGKFIGYSKEDVDFFIVKCNGIEEYYVVPYEIGNLNHSLNLYPHRLKMRVQGLDWEKYRNAFNLINEFFE